MNRHYKNTIGRYGGKTWVDGKLVEAIFGFVFWDRFWGTTKGNNCVPFRSPPVCVSENDTVFGFSFFHFFGNFTNGWTQNPRTPYKESHPSCPQPGTWRRTVNMNSKTETMKHGRLQAHPYCPFDFERHYPCPTGLWANGRFDRP